MHKPRGGGTLEAARPDPVLRDALRRREPQESHGLRTRLNTAREETDSGGVQGPEDGSCAGHRLLTTGERSEATRKPRAVLVERGSAVAQG